MKRLVLVVLALATMGSCFLKNAPGESGNLVSFATRADKLTYEAIYNFSITGQLAGGVSARATISQSPPTVFHRLDTTTRPPQGDPITLSSWFITNADGHFACAEYGGATRCTQDDLQDTAFGDRRLDGFFDLPRHPHALADVRKDTRTVRIHGEKGTCFEGVPVEPSPGPATSPQPTVPSERYRYDFCYSDDGILLRGRRTDLTQEEAGGSPQVYILDVVSITRVVQPSDVRLPGPVVSPDQLKP
jgi:hypothetical protein